MKRARVTKVNCLRSGLEVSDIDPDNKGVQGVIWVWIFRGWPWLTGTR